MTDDGRHIEARLADQVADLAERAGRLYGQACAVRRCDVTAASAPAFDAALAIVDGEARQIELLVRAIRAGRVALRDQRGPSIRPAPPAPGSFRARLSEAS
jgi:hypothetical protein